MDTFSTSVSTLKISSLPPPSTNHFTRNTPHAISPRPKPHFSSTSKPNSIATQKTKPFSHNNNNPSPSLPFSSSNTCKPSSPIFHHTPATGYAAAIIDVAQKTNTLHPVQRDVHRLLKFLKILKFQSDAGGAVVDPSAIRRIVEQGNFQRQVVVLVKMLMKKNKLGIVEQVLEEFVRIYDELCGTTQVVLVSSKREIGKDEMFGIAKSVHKLNGAVRVRVRNLVQQSFPSFAM
jgi:F-type H+-transporting ATPase subunit delta